MRAVYKYELANLMKVSGSTIQRYIRVLEPRLPHYKRTQSLLTPDQVAIIAQHYCINLDNLPP